MSFLLSPVRRAPSTISSVSRAFSTTRPSQLARMTIVGRIGTEPELIDINNGTNQVIRYVVGSNSGNRENRTTSWFRASSFAASGPQRDYIMGLSKGTLVYLEGDATMRVFDDSDGKKQSALNLIVTKVEVLKRPQPKSEDGTDTVE